MNRLIIALALFVFIVSGCKDDINQPVELTNKNLLHKVYSNSTYYEEFTYNSSYAIEMIQSINKGNVERATGYEYDGNHHLIKESTFNTYSGVSSYSYLMNEYDGQGRLFKTKAYLKVNETYEMRSITTYEYDYKNRLVKSNIYDTDNIKRKFTEFFYDDNENIIETKFYQEGELSFDDKYVYDDKMNPLKLASTNLNAFNYSRNNIIAHSQINYMLGGEYSNKEYKYEYNKNNYPVSYSSGGSKVIFEYY